MNKISKALILILRSEICGISFDDDILKEFSEQEIRDLCKLAHKHDLGHIVCHYLTKHNCISSPDIRKKLEKQTFLAVYRCEQMNHELSFLSSVLEKIETAFIPLKSAAIRQYYPETWMRTSCDIDILVHPCDWEKTAEYLVNNCEYKKGYTNAHDVSMMSPSGVCVELHHTLVEENIANNSHQILSNVWEYTNVCEDNKFKFSMTNEMLYLYHIAHMAKHFENGGCGIKPFLDLWILENRIPIDIKKANDLIERTNLSRFAEMSKRLYKKWFSEFDGDNDELLLLMEEFILSGGAFGNNESRVNMQQARQDSGFKYAVSRIFLPYDTLKYHYPILHKYPILTPVCEVMRWFKLLFCGGAKRSVNELKINQSISKEQMQKNKKFLKDIGL